MKRGKGIYRARAPRARTAKPLMPRVAAPAVGEVGGAEALPLPLVGLATPDEAVVALVVVGAAELGAWVDEGTADEAGGAADEAGGAAEDAGGAADDAGGAADEVGGGAADEAPAPASTAAQRVCREVMTSPIFSWHEFRAQVAAGPETILSRFLHMQDRSLAPQPAAVAAVLMQERAHSGTSLMLWAAAMPARTARTAVYFILTAFVGFYIL